jgi:hypothetical protein
MDMIELKCINESGVRMAAIIEIENQCMRV